jgi:glycosyltransferase involved in cell wall biosynthesis
MKSPKIALYYDWLNQWGGAEKVLLDLIKVFPKAPILTLVYNPKKTDWLPKNVKIISSFINKLPFSKRNPIFYTPLYSLALEQFDLSKFDIVISTTSNIGHGLITQPKQLFVCYLHNVNRYVYQTPKTYSWLKPLLKKYKKIDFIYSKRPDYLLCNSQTVQERIKTHYHRDSKILYPGIDINFFIPAKDTTTPKDKYFLVVSRLVPHKKIGLVIKTCSKLKLNLKIVGEGRQKKELQKLIYKYTNSKIELLGMVTDRQLLSLYQNCQALICPQEEDFGLTSIEAQACGKPVIAFNKGGFTETVINKVTGLLFNHQTVKSLAKALEQFNPDKFLTKDCINNAKRFSNKIFMLNFKQTITRLWQEHQKKIIIL